MSIDALQEKIRKRKSALIVDMTIYPGQLPEHWAGECFENGYKQYVLELLKGLKGLVPGVRFRTSGRCAGASRRSGRNFPPPERMFQCMKLTLRRSISR